MAFRFTTAGESHGPGLVAIVEGVPAGLELDRARLDADMARRQLGHGRGGRMKIESDAVEIRSGVRHGRTLGSPIAILVANRDYANWEERMNPWPVPAEVDEVHTPRPGHADLAGLLKYGHSDVRNVLERASARETAARVAAGAVARELLRAVGVSVHSHVLQIGSTSAPATSRASTSRRSGAWTRLPARRWSPRSTGSGRPTRAWAGSSRSVPSDWSPGSART
jgi:chorismate synthase